MLFAVLSGYISAIIILFAGKMLRGRGWSLVSLLPLFLFFYFISLLTGVSSGNSRIYNYNWVPSAGVNLSFNADGLSILFTLLITGIGFLVFWYAAAYLNGHRYLSRFFAYLCIFMSSMLGLVLSDNVISLFIFWELTSISSFFLIGFNNAKC
jgi:multicomponent Na+:H+ antiporter subunit A